MILPVSLSYDHRVINGVEAGEFMVDLKIELEKKLNDRHLAIIFLHWLSIYLY